MPSSHPPRVPLASLFQPYPPSACYRISQLYGSSHQSAVWRRRRRRRTQEIGPAAGGVPRTLRAVRAASAVRAAPAGSVKPLNRRRASDIRVTCSTRSSSKNFTRILWIVFCIALYTLSTVYRTIVPYNGTCTFYICRICTGYVGRLVGHGDGLQIREVACCARQKANNY